MTPDTFDRILIGFAIVCAVMAVVNLFLIRRRGVSAGLLALAFLGLAATIFLYRLGFSQPIVIGSGVVVFLLLLGDFVLRAPNQTRRRPPE